MLVRSNDKAPLLPADLAPPGDIQTSGHKMSFPTPHKQCFLLLEGRRQLVITKGGNFLWFGQDDAKRQK